MAEKIKIASITSEAHPQNGQKHRSSGNFSTEGVPGGFSKFYWEVSEIDDPGSVKFDVKLDRSLASDKTEYENLKNGSVTEIKEERTLYIANPAGAYGKNFVVSVYATNS